ATNEYRGRIMTGYDDRYDYPSLDSDRPWLRRMSDVWSRASSAIRSIGTTIIVVVFFVRVTLWMTHDVPRSSVAENELQNSRGISKLERGMMGPLAHDRIIELLWKLVRDSGQAPVRLASLHWNCVNVGPFVPSSVAIWRVLATFDMGQDHLPLTVSRLVV